MADTIRFEVNMPQRLELLYVDGKEVEGKFGLQFYHKTTDGRAVYLDPPVEKMIAAQGIEPREEIEICKVKLGKQYNWTVRRVIDRPVPLQPKPEPQGIAEAPRQQLAAPLPGATYTSPRIGQAAAASLYAGCLMASIDAYALARDYAKSKGIDCNITLEFNAEDARAAATAMFIQSFAEAKQRAEIEERKRRRSEAA